MIVFLGSLPRFVIKFRAKFVPYHMFYALDIITLKLNRNKTIGAGKLKDVTLYRGISIEFSTSLISALCRRFHSKSKGMGLSTF